MFSLNHAYPGRACVCLLPLLLSGCFGGGGGGGDEAPAAGNIAVAGADSGGGAFTAVSHSPAAGASAAPLDGPVSVSFNRELDAASVTPESFTLHGPLGPVAARQVYADGAQAHFIADAPLALAASYSAAARFTSTRGEAGDSRWSFTTRDGTWQGPELVAPLAGEARVVVQDLAFDAAGNAMMVFGTDAGLDPAGGRLWVARYTAGSGWGSPRVIGDDAFLFYDSVDLEMTPDGRAVVLAQYYDDTPAYVIAHSYDPASGWSPVQRVGVGTENGANPRLAVDAGGNAMAVWAHYDEFDRNPDLPEGLLASRLSWGQGWSPAQEVGVSPVRRPGVALAMNAGGEALLVWEDDIPYGEQQDVRRVYARRYRPQSGWEAPAALGSLSTFYGAEVEALLSDDGTALAVWSDSPRVMASRYAEAQGWQADAEVASAASGRYAALDGLAADAAGGAVLLYRVSGGGDAQAQRVYGAVQAASGWSASLLEEGEIGPAGADLAVDAAGNALAVWRVRPRGSASDAPFEIHASRYAAAWGEAERLDAAPSGVERPQVGLDAATGTGWALWAQSAGGGSEIWGRAFR